tara:strand:- start:7327 stop:7989 length:663 start_codon:yes stop_codon:yes gene_type:complete
MAVNLKSTSACAPAGVKTLVYGAAGTGKTTLIAGMPTPLILSAESGLLSLQGSDLAYIEVNSVGDLREAYKWLVGSQEAKHFESVCLDSISEIAEVCLGEQKALTKDGRAAYGQLGTVMGEVIRAFRDLPLHVLLIAKLDKGADELGRITYSPGMPGQMLTQSLPYFFDEVLALRVTTTGERELLCHPDSLWLAKDRSGRLDRLEPPDLGALIKKIRGTP